MKAIFVATITMAISAASAQTAYTFWSAEASAARAQSVFRGVVVDVKKLPAEEGFAPQISITIRVTAVLKGRPARTVTVDGNIFGRREDRFNLWKESKAQFLWFDFGDRSPKPIDQAPVRGLTPPSLFQSWDAIRLSPPDSREETLKNYAEAEPKATFGMDLQVYKTPKELLSHVQSFLKKAHGDVPLAHFMIPPALAKQAGYSGGDNRIVIPVTAGSEAIMRHLIDHPESALGKSSTPEQAEWIRSHAIRILSYFKSEKNVALLKTLLAAPGKGPFQSTPFAGTAPPTYFWTRLAAYDVLKLWGIEVPMPDLNEKSYESFVKLRAKA